MFQQNYAISIILATIPYKIHSFHFNKPVSQIRVNNTMTISAMTHVAMFTSQQSTWQTNKIVFAFIGCTIGERNITTHSTTFPGSTEHTAGWSVAMQPTEEHFEAYYKRQPGGRFPEKKTRKPFARRRK